MNGLNGLNEQICDPLFREVVSVEPELDSTQTRRNLQVGTGTRLLVLGTRPLVPSQE